MLDEVCLSDRLVLTLLPHQPHTTPTLELLLFYFTKEIQLFLVHALSEDAHDCKRLLLSQSASVRGDVLVLCRCSDGGVSGSHCSASNSGDTPGWL